MAMSIKDALQSINGAEVEVEGILSSLTEGITRTGSPYISGELFAKGYSIPLKIWDFGLERWSQTFGLTSGDAAICRGSISVNPQNHETQLCLRNTEGLASVEKIEDEVKKMELSSATPIPVPGMINAIRGLVESRLPEGHDLRAVALKGVAVLQQFGYYPYSVETHKEKGGFVAHIYNCCNKIVYATALPEEVDWSVVLVSLLFYHLGFINRAGVDKDTGVVTLEDPTRAAEYGSNAIYDMVYGISALEYLAEAKETATYRNVAHCIAALNKVAEPCTIEAAEVVTIVQNELLPYAVSEALRGCEKEGEKAYGRYNGSLRTFVRL